MRDRITLVLDIILIFTDCLWIMRSNTGYKFSGVIMKASILYNDALIFEAFGDLFNKRFAERGIHRTQTTANR